MVFYIVKLGFVIGEKYNMVIVPLCSQGPRIHNGRIRSVIENFMEREWLGSAHKPINLMYIFDENVTTVFRGANVKDTTFKGIF